MKNILNPFSEQLTANRQEDFPFNGRQFYMASASSPVSLEFLDDSRTSLGRARGVVTGLSLTVPPGICTVRIMSTIDQIVTWYEAAEGIDLNQIAGTLTVTQQQAATISNEVIAVSGVAEPVITANASRKRAIFTAHRENEDMVLMGGAALDVDNAAVCLEPGDFFEDTITAGAERFALALRPGDRLSVEYCE